MRYLIIVIFFSPLLLLSQEKGTFKVELESSYRTFNLKDLNGLINDPYYTGYENYDKVSIKNGLSYGLQLSYNFILPLSLGIYGEYQYSSTSQKLYYNIEYLPGYYLQEITLKKLKIRSYSFGLNTNIILNNLPFWKNNSWLSRIESNINIQTGYGKVFFSSSSEMIPTDQMNVHNAGTELYNDVYSSSGFQLITSLKLGYIFTQKKYFSSMGLKIGYQYFTTSNIEQGSKKKSPMIGRETKINLSGLTAGIYLTFGR